VFVAYPPALRTVIYPTTAIASLNDSRRNVLKNRGAFPTEEAILKGLDLGMQRMPKKWTMPLPEWKRALNQLAIVLGERVPTSD